MRLCAFVLLVAARGGFAADTLLADYAPAGTKVVFGVRLHNILNALVTADDIRDMRARTAAMMAQAGAPGFDPFNDLDELLVATTGDDDKAPSIAILRGRFDVERLARGAQRYRGIPLIDNGKDAGFVTALVDASTAITGTPAVVRAAIDNHGGASLLPAKLAARAGELRAQYDIWGTADDIKAPAQATGQAAVFQGIDRFDFGAAFLHGLKLTAALHVRSAKDAEDLQGAINMLRAMMGSAPKSAPGPAKFDMQFRENVLKVSLDVPESELKKAVQTQKSSLSSALLARLGAAPEAAAPKPKPSPPRTVLDSTGSTIAVTLPGGH